MATRFVKTGVQKKRFPFKDRLEELAGEARAVLITEMPGKRGLET